MVEQHHLRMMLEYLLLIDLFRATLGTRHELAAENLLPRHQLAILTCRPRQRPRLRARVKALWIVARRR